MKAIGIDIGTTGIGGILIDAKNGQVLKSVTKNSNSFILTDNAFEKIQSVDKIIGIATEILDGLVSNEVVAIGDNQASVLGSCRQDELLINVGTGSQVSIISENCVLGENVETRPYFEGKYLTVGSALCGGRAYSLTKDFLREVLSAKGEVLEVEVYSIMTEMLNGIKNPTVKADTRFAGTRQDKSIRGGFYNISVNNFRPAEFIHAVLQGMAEELYSLYNSFGEERKILVGTGNGVRKNLHFVKCVESLFGANLKIPAQSEETSFGSALFALIAVGKFKTVGEAQRIIKYLD